MGFERMKIAIIALTSSIIDSTIKAFATESYQMYLSSSFGLFRLISMPMTLSLISKTVDKEEVGKIFSATTSLECFSGLLAGILYTFVYNNTFTIFPGAFNLLSSFVFAFNLILMVLISRWKNV
jgi:MFS transporter, PCFT/HCP family, solute carrier family 46 (folate transporter), member 1